jgi:aerobic-type carbon monoxide dehydrogenase small subunit (CoxS/CutS family)
MSERLTRLRLNGPAHPVEADAAKPLLWVLRDQPGPTGTRCGCRSGRERT